MRKETMLGCGVVAIAATVVGFVGWRSLSDQSDLAEGAKMRRLYIALSMYESQWDGEPAPTLAHIIPLVSEPTDFTSQKDPYRDAKAPFPVDGGIPKSPRNSPVRVSFTYLWAHRSINGMKTAPWSQVRQDPGHGFLVSEWRGSVEPTGDYGAKVGGKILRVNSDGSLVTLHRHGTQSLGDAEELFLRRR